MTTEEKLQNCLDTLLEIKDSGYWPFASPAPCSTERKIKDGIYDAIEGVESALFWHRQMFSKIGRDDMKAPNFTIVEL